MKRLYWVAIFLFVEAAEADALLGGVMGDPAYTEPSPITLHIHPVPNSDQLIISSCYSATDVKLDVPVPERVPCVHRYTGTLDHLCFLEKAHDVTLTILQVGVSTAFTVATGGAGALIAIPKGVGTAVHAGSSVWQIAESGGKCPYASAIKKVAEESGGRSLVHAQETTINLTGKISSFLWQYGPKCHSSQGQEDAGQTPNPDCKSDESIYFHLRYQSDGRRKWAVPVPNGSTLDPYLQRLAAERPPLAAPPRVRAPMSPGLPPGAR